MQYWEFFPANEQEGIIPVWGFADVVASHCEGIDINERFYGFFPMSTHLMVEPHKIIKTGFFDGAIHRAPLPAIYNQYVRCNQDPLYTQDTEALQMLLRPLLTTSFLLDDFFADNDFFNSEQLIVTSASSKTALGFAFSLQRNRSSRDKKYSVIGLTSSNNFDFVTALGCYDQVISYDQLHQIKTTQSAIIDFAGNGQVLGNLHEQLKDQLMYSCLVGLSHWDQRSGLPENLPGPAPQIFFAPSQGEKRMKDWGSALFQEKLSEVWQHFSKFVANWIDIKTISNSNEILTTYHQLLKGQSNPKEGYILSLTDT